MGHSYIEDHGKAEGHNSWRACMRIDTNRQLRTQIENLYIAGDGSGVSRGIIGAAATGIIAARDIASEREN